MSGTGGYGGGPYGGAPYGGAASPSPINPFDLYCFEHCSPMLNILGAPAVSTGGSGTQFVVDYPQGPGLPNVTCDLGILSGELGNLGFATSDARLIISAAVSDRFTFEWVVKFEELPFDFTDMVNKHVGFFTTDSSGPCAGLFVSQVGVAYAGGVHHSGGNMVLDSILQVIPDTGPLIEFDTYTTFRIAADTNIGAVYVFITPTADVPVTGHKLVAILPLITASDLSFPPTDGSLVTVRGTTAEPSRIALDSICLADTVVIPNLAPVADAGEDQAVRFCSIVQLDGRESFDPEGAPVTYFWRLIDAPIGSAFSIEGNDGITHAIDASGLTDKFHSPSTLAALDAIDPVQAGDVLVVQGVARTIVATGVDGDGFYLLFASQDIPDNLGPNEPFKVLRQRAIKDPDTAQPTFYPDKPGFYKFDLIVSDGSLSSDETTVIINVLETPLPRGCTPNMEFLFSFLSDFWNLVEERDVIPVFWGALAQTAATELFTLWQLEYSKSLRDVQRQFIRRWLHCDLLLGEPIPELTKIRVVWGGITSEPIPAAGVATGDFTFDISSPIFSDVETIVISSTGTLTRDSLAGQLTQRLAELDDRFSVVTFDNRTATNEYVRIDAPFPFSIDDSSTVPASLFLTDQENRHPFDSTGGSSAGQGAYRVSRSLYKLDIQEDDFLSLDGQVFRIARVVDNVADDLPFQRVVLKETLPVAPPNAWDITGWTSSELLDFYNGLVSKDDVLTFEVVDSVGQVASSVAENALVETKAFGASEAFPGRVPFDPLPLGYALARPDEVAVRLAFVLRRTYLPIDPLIQDIPTFSAKVVIKTTTDEEAVLRRNVDFFLEEYRGRSAVRFMSSLGADVWEGENPPNRLWAEYAYIDNNPLIEGNFGIPAEFTLDDLAQIDANIDYLSAVRGLWYAFFNGPTLQNLRIGTQILLGLPFAEVNGVIEEIRTDFSPSQGRILIRDSENDAIVRSYGFPKVLGLETNPTTGKVYAVGDTVKQFAPLVTGAEIIDYIKDPKWFEGLLNQGVFFEVEKYHKFLTRVDSAAFSLSTLLFVRNFILKIKPTYTYPLIVVQKEVDDADVDVLDEVEFVVRLKLNDWLCGSEGGSTMFDDYRAAGGGIWNKFDHDNDSITVPPTFPTSDTNITWAFDKGFNCPEATSGQEVTTSFDTDALIQFDQAFFFGPGSPITIAYYFMSAPGGGVAAVPTVGQLMVAHDASDPTNLVHTSGTVDRATVHTTRSTAANPRTASTGTITTIAGSLLVDGQTFSLNDGYVTWVYEFNSTGSVTAGRVEVPFTSLSTADEVRDAIISAVNSSFPRITASNGGAATVSLVHQDLGPIGNQVITETVVNAGFVVSGMSGGSDLDDLLLVVFVNAVEIAAVPFTVPKGGEPCIDQEIEISPGVAVSTTFSTGSITTVAGANLVDGETFTIDDGMHPAVVFEFDDDASVGGSNVAVPFTGGDTATQVRDAIIAAINGPNDLQITATVGGAAVVTLTRDVGGLHAVAIAETVVDAGFIVAGMSGGGGDAVTVGIRAASSPARNYPWQNIRVRLFQDDEIASWNFGDGLPEGTYSFSQ